MGSSQARPEITSHALSRAHIDTKSLRSEWNAYLRWQGRKHGDALTKKTLWKFVHDMELLLGLSQLYNVDEMISAELVSFEEFKQWFVQVSQRVRKSEGKEEKRGREGKEGGREGREGGREGKDYVLLEATL